MMRFKFSAIIFFFLTFLFGLFSPAFAQTADAFEITGTVTDQNGQGIQNVSITATDPGGSTVQFGPSTTAANGSYLLNIDPGTYDIHFAPSSGFNPIVHHNFIVSSNQVLNVQLVSITHTLSGTLSDGNGDPIVGARVNYEPISGSTGQSNEDITDQFGHYSMVLQAGIYNLHTLTGTTNGVSFSVRSPSLQVDMNNGDQTQDLELTTAAITVHAQYSNGSPVVGADAGASSSQDPNSFTSVTAGGSIDARVLSERSSTQTGSDGVAHLYGLKHSTYRVDGICVGIPGSTLCNTSPIILNSDISLTFTFPLTYTLSGTVQDSNGNPIAGAGVNYEPVSGSTGQSNEDSTDQFGHYSMLLQAGRYSMHTLTGTADGVHFTVRSPSLQVDMTNGDQVQDLQLTTSTITITAQYSNGDPVVGANVGASNSQDPNSVTSVIAGGPIDARVLSESSSSQTDANGIARVYGLKYSTYQVDGICAGIPGTTICNTSSVTLNGNVALTFTFPVTHMLSGTVQDSNGNPIAGAHVNYEPISGSTGQGNTTSTDSSGHYSMVLQSGIYRMQNLTSSSQLGTFDVRGGPSLQVDMTSNNQTQDLQLNFAKITVTVKDVNGNPISGVDVGASNSQDPNSVTSVTAGGPIDARVLSESSSSVTDSNGTAHVYGLKYSTYPVDGICAGIPGSTICNASSITLNGDMAFIFQQQPEVTPTPTATPTNTPTPTPANVAPVVGTITAPSTAVEVNAVVNATAGFTDGNPGDTHTAIIDWGDGMTSLGDVTESNGSGNISGTHVYLNPDVYEVTVIVTDNSNASDSEIFQYVSVYYPTQQGLFTAVTKFQSPAGALIGNPTLTGQVKFGVSSSYTGSSATGDTDMNFTVGNFEFISTTIQSLVIANGKASLTGTGTVNGQTGYTFLVTGLNGTGGGQGLIRYQIKDSSNVVVYDTQPGAPATANPTTPVIGQVIVH